MSLQILALADGRLPVATGVLYTVPVGRTTIIKTITVVNTDVATRQFNLYLRRTGTLRNISPANQSIGAGWKSVEDDPHTMQSGDTVEGNASVGGVIDYTIDGVENA